MRTPFQRDRDRVVHATAFRRLTYKTQVFLAHEGDHFRTRLTHSLEVSQIARSMARLLQLDEDLAEALALAHDLGHPPFGHAGERALAEAMRPYGGFDHNAQSLKVVTRLESKYLGFDGLNLTFETLEGLVKHNGPLSEAREEDAILLEAVADAGLRDKLRLDQQAPAEAQVAAIADDVAYNNHDIDDGLRAGLFGLEDLIQVPFAGEYAKDVMGRADAAGRGRAIYEINRRMITAMVEDIVRESRMRIERAQPRSIDEIRAAEGPIVGFSEPRRRDLAGLRAFLFERVYRNERVMRVMREAEDIVRDLFARYMAGPESLPRDRGSHLHAVGEKERAAHVADFIAGMTDRYAIAEHRRLFDATPDLR
jgi:dGTPase